MNLVRADTSENAPLPYKRSDHPFPAPSRRQRLAAGCTGESRWYPSQAVSWHLSFALYRKCTSEIYKVRDRELMLRNNRWQSFRACSDPREQVISPSALVLDSSSLGRNRGRLKLVTFRPQRRWLISASDHTRSERVRSRSTSPGAYKTAMSTPAQSPEETQDLDRDASVPLISSRPLDIASQSSRAIGEKPKTGGSSRSTYVYVHPTYGALFAHLAQDVESAMPDTYNESRQTELASPGRGPRLRTRGTSTEHGLEQLTAQGHAASQSVEPWLGSQEAEWRQGRVSRSSSVDKSGEIRRPDASTQLIHSINSQMPNSSQAGTLCAVAFQRQHSDGLGYT